MPILRLDWHLILADWPRLCGSRSRRAIRTRRRLDGTNSRSLSLNAILNTTPRTTLRTVVKLLNDGVHASDLPSRKPSIEFMENFSAAPVCSAVSDIANLNHVWSIVNSAPILGYTVRRNFVAFGS